MAKKKWLGLAAVLAAFVALFRKKKVEGEEAESAGES
jgi:hypothetical protein